MAGSSKVTTDHEVIKKWVEDRGGKPSSVVNTEGKDDPGLLRVDFPGRGRDEGRRSLEEISWDDFFQKFDEKQLAFLYQDEMKSGAPSRFFKFVSRETAENKEKAEGERASRRSTSSRSGTRAKAGSKNGDGEAKADTKKTDTKAKAEAKKSDTKATAAPKKAGGKAKADTKKADGEAKTAARRTASRARPAKKE